MMFVVLQDVRVIGIISLHARTVMGIVPFVPAGGTNEIERAIVRAIGTAFLAGNVLVVIHGHFLYIADGTQDWCAVIGINRTYNLVGMVVTLQGNVDLTLLHHGQHAITEHRRLFIRRVVGTREQVEVG